MFLSCLFIHFLSCASIMAYGSALRISAVLRKPGGRPLAVAVTHAQHAHTIIYTMNDAHAACHAARTHMERLWDRSWPRLRPGSSLPSGKDACSMRFCACTLFFMSCYILMDVHAACHAINPCCRRARPDLTVVALIALHECLTLPDATAAQFGAAL